MDRATLHSNSTGAARAAQANAALALAARLASGVRRGGHRAPLRIRQEKGGPLHGGLAQLGLPSCAHARARPIRHARRPGGFGAGRQGRSWQRREVWEAHLRGKRQRKHGQNRQGAERGLQAGQARSPSAQVTARARPPRSTRPPDTWGRRQRRRQRCSESERGGGPRACCRWGRRHGS